MMENWQFFLQKEGDDAWLPLETPQVEILEGRYQLIAHTPNAGSSVCVCIRHQYEQQNIPQENIQESVRQVASSGKLELLPLVYLGLGSWSISCHSLIEDTTAKLLSPSQQSFYSLEIEVLPQDFDLFEDWKFESAEPENTSVQAASMISVELELGDLADDIENGLNGRALPVLDSREALFEKTQCESADVPTAQPPYDDSSATIQTDEFATQASRFEPDTLILPTFSTDVPAIEFRTVSPKELPRLVSDEISLESNSSPQLPPFTRSKAMLRTRQEKRGDALSKIKFIASAVSHHEPQQQLSRSTRQEKFQSKLAQMALAVGS